MMCIFFIVYKTKSTSSAVIVHLFSLCLSPSLSTIPLIYHSLMFMPISVIGPWLNIYLGHYWVIKDSATLWLWK
jgi:hypothetical protein